MSEFKRIEDLSISRKKPKDIYFVLAQPESIFFRKNTNGKIQKSTGYGWVVDDQIHQDLEIVIIKNFPMAGM